jgi:hypothetical protein
MKLNLVLCTVLSAALTACGGGGGSSSPQAASDCSGACSTTSAAPDTSSPDSSPTPAAAVQLGVWPTAMLQAGTDADAYWLQDGVWGPGSLTRGKYTGLNGWQYEQSMGVSPTTGPKGEVTGRISWGWPTGTTEVKSYMAFLAGNKPGWANSWTKPGGYAVQLPNGKQSDKFPSGKTPGSIFPMQLPIASLKSSVRYQHNATPTGRGHLSYDIWLQNTPAQPNSFSAPPITHEIMIPLDYWGNYGAYGYRNPKWYSHDATIDGRLWHIYFVRNFPSGQPGTGWAFTVFEPDQPGIKPGTLDLAAFINYLTTQKDAAGSPWAQGNEYCVSVELGVEPVEGTGDMTLDKFRVWK